jgi:hypothetical protein
MILTVPTTVKEGAFEDIRDASLNYRLPQFVSLLDVPGRDAG